MMETQSQTKPDPMKDPIEEGLAFLEEEDKKFRNHWVWKKLNCSPEKFFQAFEKHVGTLKIPQDKWETALQKAKDASRVRSKEKRTTFNPINLQMMQSLQV